ncbi:hypothetical protein [Nonomuraea wenchangensis]|uniref:hypothetical protein n=1 Tax=Nonomuraea wenchangensis TaxID=568860 RepID=UPI0033257D96
MRHDDPPDLPEESPYPGYDGPRGFDDACGGYPIEEEPPTPSPSNPDGPPPADLPPASPRTGRRLHNPLPGIQPVHDDDAWYGPEPDRARWKVITPIALLLVSAGVGVWLALPASQQAPTAHPEPATTSPTTPTSSPHPERASATRWAPPSQPRSSRTPASSTPTPPLHSASPRQSPTHTPPPRTPPHSTSPTPPPQPRPIVTITRKVTITSTLRPTSLPTDDGPEEPPAPTSRTTGTSPGPTCVTWGDCHDNPPKG